MSVSAKFAGDHEQQGAVVLQQSKGASAIAKGDVLSLSSNKWVTAATNAAGPFAVAKETKASGDATISILFQGIVYVVADGTINPNNRVQVSGSTAGRVIVSADAGATQGQTTNFQRNVGIYLGHENEGDGVTEATACASGDTIRILLGAY